MSQDFSRGNLGSSKGKPPAFSQNSTGSSTKGAHDASVPASGEMSKVGSLANGHGKSDSMGKATGCCPPAASTNMSKIREVADGK